MQDHAAVGVYALEIKKNEKSLQKDWIVTWPFLP